ncbi:hypothetical protein PISMIDRAFT_166343 [Pisolithus microcarpus 441]|uniref:Uncharacterized protein n=1 Tax=Pisolithus microcarpus 441 TaxID=765257 RepID=A0A0C9ZEF8_9AGAM|nr:hypothetical protein PISMIDRAFT_166343 [Pisolithus microcarpus 441]
MCSFKACESSRQGGLTATPTAAYLRVGTPIVGLDAGGRGSFLRTSVMPVISPIATFASAFAPGLPRLHVVPRSNWYRQLGLLTPVIST